MRDSGSREMFKTVCSNCGKDCEVPFRPTSGKPVYCSDCFEKMGGRNSDTGRPERPDKQSLPFQGRNRSDFNERPQAPRVDNNKAQLDVISQKLDKIIALLTPKAEKEAVEKVATAPVVEEIIVKKKVKTPKVKKVAKK